MSNLFWKTFMKIAKVKKLSKYEKKFILFDLGFTGGTYGKAIGTLILLQNAMGLILAVVYILLNAWIRKLVWNGMENKEQKELFKIPKKDKINVFDVFKKEGIVGEKAVGQWGR